MQARHAIQQVKESTDRSGDLTTGAGTVRMTHSKGGMATSQRRWQIGYGRFTRDVDSGRYTELFLMSAISSVIVIRSFLALSGYPQVGGSNFHIAHMLYGGFFMLVALLLTVTFESRVWKAWAAVLGGVGFGTFIDELGKFITRDNDYFFQPTIALIYIIFVAIFLATRVINRHRMLTQDEKVVFALAAVREALLGTLDESARLRALRYLDECDPDDPAVVNLRVVLTQIPARPLAQGNLYRRCRRKLADYYGLVIAQPRVQTGIAALFMLSVVTTIAAFFVPEARDELHANVISAGSSVLSGIFNVLGVIQLRRSRYEAFRWFERSVLISIFVTQVFLFNDEGLLAIFTLAGNLLLFGAIRFALAQEREAALDEAASSATARIGSTAA